MELEWRAIRLTESVHVDCSYHGREECVMLAELVERRQLTLLVVLPLVPLHLLLRDAIGHLVVADANFTRLNGLGLLMVMLNFA